MKDSGKDIETFNYLSNLHRSRQDNRPKLKEIAFGWMSPALVTGNKSMIRQCSWSNEYAKCISDNEIFIALDKVRVNGGTDIALIRLTNAPYKQHRRETPESDYAPEGFEYFGNHPEMLPEHLKDVDLWEHWADFKKQNSYVYVLRFEIIHLIYSEFLERAAIMEFDGKMKLNVAERAAYLLTKS